MNRTQSLLLALSLQAPAEEHNVNIPFFSSVSVVYIHSSVPASDQALSENTLEICTSSEPKFSSLVVLLFPSAALADFSFAPSLSPSTETLRRVHKGHRNS